MNLRLLLSTLLVFAPYYAAKAQPTMTLNTGGIATYQAGSGSPTLNFTHQIEAGESTNNVTIVSPGINLNGMTIKDAQGNDANLSSVVGNLSGTVSLNASSVNVASVTVSPTSGTLTTGQQATITVRFNAPITVTGTPTLALNTGATVNYSSGSATVSPAFYVATTGNDSNVGSQASPFLTLLAARNAMRASATKTTYVRAGTYNHPTLTLDQTTDNVSTWSAYPGEVAILNGSGTQAEAFNIDNASATINVNGFTIQNYTNSGIDYGGGGHLFSNNIIKNITTSGTNGGCFYGHYEQTPGSTITISHNTCQDVNSTGIVWASTGSGDPGMRGLTIIDRNIVLNSCLTQADCGAIYGFDAAVSNGHAVQITNNIVGGSYGTSPAASSQGKGIYLDDAVSNATVTGNVIYGNGQWAIQYHGGSNNVVRNNIFDLSGANQLGLYQDSIVGGSMTGNTFTNNIVYSSVTYPTSTMWNRQGTTTLPNVTNNQYYTTTGSFPNSGAIVDSNRVISNPSFQDATGHNYVLQSGSTAFNAPVSFPQIVNDQGPGVGGTDLRFIYTVASNQTAQQLATAASALSVNGGSIKDASGTNVSLSGANSVNLGSLVVNPSGGADCSGANYYVASSGSNSNNGTSTGTPWQTLAKVNSPGLNFGPGSCIHQTTNLVGNLVLSTANTSGTSLSNPVIYDCGGNTITSATTGEGTATVTIDSVPGFRFRNCTVRGHASNNGIGVYVKGSAAGFVTSNDVGGHRTSGTKAHNIYLETSGDITVDKNVVHGLTGPSSTDDFGIHISTSGTALITGNHIYDIGGRTGANGAQNGYSGNSIQFDNVTSGNVTIEHNLIHDGGGNTDTCGGPSGILAFTVTAPHVIRYNEIYNIRPISYTTGCDWVGIDLDGNVKNGVVEHNYVHGVFGSGIMAYIGNGNGTGWGPNTFRYNVMENNYYAPYNTDYWANLSFQQKGATGGGVVYAYGNSIFSNVSGSYGLSFVTDTSGAVLAAGSVVANNLIYGTSANTLVACHQGTLANVTFESNAYYRTSGSFSLGAGCGGSYPATSLAAWQGLVTGGDTGATTANPSLLGTLPVGGCTWSASAQTGPQPCPAGYALTSSSTAYRNTGTNVSSLVGGSMGSRDYFGNTIPSGTGTGYGIGADNSGSTPVAYVGPLDATSGTNTPEACYSTRACSAAAATAGKNAYQLTRESDTTTLNVALQTNGTANEGPAISFCNGTLCHITTWYDQVNSNHVSQATLGNAPAWVRNCINSVTACLKMDDTDTGSPIRMLATSSFGGTSAQPYSVSYVARYENVYNNDQYIWGTSTVGTKSGGGHRAGGGIQISIEDNFFTVPTPDDASWLNVQNVINAGSSSIMINGTNNNGSVPGTVGLISRFQIGSTKDDGYTVYGSIGEVIVWKSTALDSTQKTNVCHNQRLWANTAGSC